MNGETTIRDANSSKHGILRRGILLGLASLAIGIAATTTAFAGDTVPAGDQHRLQ